MYTSYPFPVTLGTDDVATSNIQDGAVTTAKIAATAVTAQKIATDAVTRTKIINDAINADKIDSAAADAIKTKLAALTPVNDNGTDLGSSSFRVRTAFISTSIVNAGDLAITLTGATSRSLTISNSNPGQVVNIDLDGEMTVRAGTAYGVTFSNDPSTPFTNFRAAYFPDASGRVILDSDVRATRIRVPLVPYASVDIASPATQTLALFRFDPNEYAVPGKTTTLTFKVFGGTSSGNTTLSLYNLTDDTEDASVTATGGLTSFSYHTDSVALPGGTKYFAVRGAVGTDGEYFIGSIYLDVTWT